MDPEKKCLSPARRLASVCVLATAVACGGQVASGEPDGSSGSGTVCGLAAAPAPQSDGGCGSGVVTFQLAGAKGSQWWIDQSQASGSSDANWLTVACPSGAQLDLLPTEATTSRDCRTCPSSWSVTTGLSTWKLPSTDQSQTWDGTYFAPGTCGAQSLACVSPRCAPPGRYIATMCACDSADQTPIQCRKPTCVEVPFQYPVDGLVIGLLPNP
jgi:hypothetical protein